MCHDAHATRPRLVRLCRRSVDTADGKHHFDKYPKALRKIKWEAVRLAVTSLLIQAAKEHKEGSPARKGSSWGTAMRNMGSDHVGRASTKRRAARAEATQGALTRALARRV